MRKIGTKILFAGLLNMIVIVIALVGVSFFTIRNENTNRIIQMENQLRVNYDYNIKAQVEIIISELDGIINQMNEGLISRTVAEKIAADIIRNARYGENGYFWADDLQGNNIVLLGREDVEGKNRINLQDENDQYIIKDMLLIAKNGGGYYDYFFPKAGEVEPSPKRAYIKVFEPFGWGIGTGNYIDEIDEIVLREKELAREQFTKNIWIMGVVTVISLIIGSGISLAMSKTITKPIKVLTELINKTAELDIRNDKSYEVILNYKDETGIMSKAVVELRNVIREIISELKIDSNSLEVSSSVLNEIVKSGKEGIDGVTHTVSEFAQGAEEQANDAQIAVEKMELLAQEISKSVERSERIIDNTDEINRRNQKGVYLVSELADKFEITRVSSEQLNKNVANLSESSAQIGDITSAIQSIAAQTNLLALNAAIEAARAGDKGLGFTVVANEIRKLSLETVSSTEKIRQTLTNIQKSVNEITASIQEVVIVGRDQVSSTEEISNIITKIHSMSKELNKYASEL